MTALLCVLGTLEAALGADYTVVRGPEMDPNGVVTYSLTSPYLRGECRIRLLSPKARTDKILFVLPVTPWPGFEDKWKKHGDGLSELLKHDSQNRFRTIMVAPDFPDNMPWFVDHASDPKRRHETYMMKVVLPFVDSVLKIKRPQRDLIGFSKSGYGAVRLLLGHPEAFHACAGWDPGGVNKPYEPLNTGSLSYAAGSGEQFDAVKLASLIHDQASAFQDGPRIALSGYSSAAFQDRLDTLHAWLKDAEIPHLYTDTVRVPHHWFTGWLEQAMVSLASMSRTVETTHIQPPSKIDWAAFLARHDLLWTRLPQSWFEAPFLGNGMMGSMFFKDPANNAMILQVQRADVQDHRRTPETAASYDRPRLPIGEFRLIPQGKITGGRIRLDLWNAEAKGRIITEKGHIDFRVIVHADEMAIVAELAPSEDETDCRWQWQPAKAFSPRQAYGRTTKVYPENPPWKLLKARGTDVCVQPLLAGGETATAWKTVAADTRKTLYVSVAHTFPQADALRAAVAAVNRVSEKTLSNLSVSHRRWWHGYYPQSFISLPDTRIESFYWIQMYKLASATRAEGALIDNQGPWLQKTPRPGAWWNLNVQLTYWPTYTANRLGLSASLSNTLKRNMHNLIDNVLPEYRHDSAGIGRSSTQDCISPVGVPGRKDTGDFNTPEIGLLPWACHNLWLEYRHSMDETLLRETLFPLLRRTTNYYHHFLERDEDGTLHLPPTYSPEYGVAADCNFDLALLRWSCQRLLEIAERLKISDPLAPMWKDTLATLTPYPMDETGFLIGRGMPYQKSHRHYSHLLMIYPLYLVNRDQRDASELIKRSLAHWHSLPKSLRGYSFTGYSSISSALGNGDDAALYLNKLLDNTDSRGEPFIRENTLYRESGPVIETPLSAAQCVHDMVLQSWGGMIRVFPALPVQWQEVVFKDLRAEGAFLVSARREAGKLKWIRIKSLAGEPCLLETGERQSLKRASGWTASLQEEAEAVLGIDLPKGKEIVLVPADTEFSAWFNSGSHYSRLKSCS